MLWVVRTPLRADSRAGAAPPRRLRIEIGRLVPGNRSRARRAARGHLSPPSLTRTSAPRA